MKFLKNLVKIAAAVFLSLIAWEILLRIFFTVPIVSDDVPGLGWLPKNARGLSTTEGRGHVQYNEFGFREGALENKPKDETRILILGDSNIEARQMDLPQTLPARLQTLLDTSVNCRVRVVNGGRVGATPAFHVALADKYQKLFQPDWTVVFVEDDRWKLTFSPSHEIRYEPQNEGFKIVTKWQGASRGRGYQILRKLHIRDLALFDWSFSRWQLMNGVGTGPDAQGEGSAERTAAKGNEAQRAAYANMKDPQMVARSMNWTLRQLKEKYPRLVILHMPSYDMNAANLKPVTAEERQLTADCQSLDLPLILMRERIAQDYAQTHQPPFGFMNTLPWTGHINAHGHNLMADALADFFCDKLCAAPQKAHD